MTQYAVECYRRITGVDPPKPFGERSLEEQRRDWDLFLQTVRDSSDEEDDAVDDLFTNIRMNIRLQSPAFNDTQEESA